MIIYIYKLQYICYTHTYTYIYVCVSVCLYIYIYMCVCVYVKCIQETICAEYWYQYRQYLLVFNKFPFGWWLNPPDSYQNNMPVTGKRIQSSQRNQPLQDHMHRPGIKRGNWRSPKNTGCLSPGTSFTRQMPKKCWYKPAHSHGFQSH